MRTGLRTRTKISNGLYVNPTNIIVWRPMARACIGRGRLLLSTVNGDVVTVCHRDVLELSHERRARDTSVRLMCCTSVSLSDVHVDPRGTDLHEELPTNAACEGGGF